MIGLVKGSGETEVFHERATFSFKIVAKVEGASDGYVARVTRMPDNVTRLNFSLVYNQHNLHNSCTILCLLGTATLLSAQLIVRLNLWQL